MFKPDTYREVNRLDLVDGDESVDETDDISSLVLFLGPHNMFQVTLNKRGYHLWLALEVVEYIDQLREALVKM
jgi:hypothetical protein